MTDSKDPQSYIKKKDKPGALVSFKTGKFFRGQIFKPGGFKPGKVGFSPGVFKTQHKG